MTFRKRYFFRCRRPHPSPLPKGEGVGYSHYDTTGGNWHDWRRTWYQNSGTPVGLRPNVGPGTTPQLRSLLIRPWLSGVR